MIDAAARAIADPRDPASVKHSIRDMLRQREYGLAQGWEELNNHPQLRQDIAFQTTVGRDDELVSAPTLCRLEKLGSRAAAVKLHVYTSNTLLHESCVPRLAKKTSR